MALQDKIGRGEIVNKICGLVGALRKDKNICLAINGAWGSGKSFVLGLIEEKLSKKQEYIIIKYDAWENTFYSDPLIAILSCVIDGIEEKLYLVERTEEKVKKAAKTGVNTLAKLSTKIEKLKAVIEGIKAIIKDFHNPIDTAALGDFKSYQKLLKATKEILNEITQAGEYREKQTKLVILVDEIDRCLPDEQLKILERLHHLFDVKNCAVIVAVNCECVSKTVKSIYDMDGSEYLRKFFSITYKLDIKADALLSSLMQNIEENVKKFDANYPVNNNIIRICCGFIMALQNEFKLLDKISNRDITEFYDCVEMICNELGWENIKCNTNLFFIVFGTFVRRIIYPDFMDSFIGQTDYNGKAIDYVGYKLHLNFEKVSETMGWGYTMGEITKYYNLFNDIVHCATYDFRLEKPQYTDRNYRISFDIQECKRLKELIIKYAGEKYVDN